MRERAADVGVVVDEDHKSPRARRRVGRGEPAGPAPTTSRSQVREKCGLSAGGRFIGIDAAEPRHGAHQGSKVSQRGHKKVL